MAPWIRTGLKRHAKSNTDRGDDENFLTQSHFLLCPGRLARANVSFWQAEFAVVLANPGREQPISQATFDRQMQRKYRDR